MHRDAGFLAAILDSPDDDSLRLIYADWLEEIGETDRAEFIRVQMEVAEVAVASDRWKALTARSRQLLACHETEWGGPVRGIVSGFEFRRGFVEVVHITAAGFLGIAERLFALAPIRSVRFQGPTGYLSGLAFTHRWDDFAASPYLSRLRTMDLSGCGLGDDRLVRLAASPHLGRLRELHLRGTRIGDAGAEALATSPSLAGLTLLDLRFNRIRMPGVRALLASPHLQAVRTIRMEGNPARVRDLVRAPRQDSSTLS